ncbi:LOG family protein [Patescibacteria group bacterium]|nr:LOG family protein [Patescibacteria group bacterium]MCL5010095.1 LOG family protein [Patescibacteria group bacterium]
MEIRSVTFFGSSNTKPSEEDFKLARKTAHEVAKNGIRVVNGGGAGIMLAATKGATDADGKTTVVYYRPELATDFEGSSTVNLAQESFEKENYIERTRKLLELGEAYIIFRGGTGTISEFGMAWGLARLYFGHHKPLILFGEFWEDIIASFKKYMKIRPPDLEVYTIVKTPNQVMEAIKKYDLILAKNRHNHLNCTDTECKLLL